MLCIAVELICNGHDRHPTRQAEPKRLAASLVGRELWKTKRDIIEESDRRQREEAEHERRMMWKFRSRCTGRTLTATSGAEHCSGADAAKEITLLMKGQ